MEMNRSTSSTTPLDIALATLTSSAKAKTTSAKAFGKKQTCSLGHMGQTDKYCKVRQIREMEREIAELKKDLEKPKPKPEQAQAATSTSAVSPCYWDLVFTCHTDDVTRTEITDTGASTHMYTNECKFDKITPTTPLHISIASKDGHILVSKHRKVKIDDLVLQDVLHSNKLSSNLISIGKLWNEGHVAFFRRTEDAVIDKNRKTQLKLTWDPHTDKLWHPVRNVHSHSANLTRADGILTAT